MKSIRRHIKTIVNKTVFLFINVMVLAQVVSFAQITDSRSKPNIIFIFSDDHTAQAIGTYGGRFAKLNPTPILDKLAAEGIRFDNTFVTNSICTPSRASMLTGQYSQTNGVLILEDPLPPEKQYLPMELHKLGYETAIIGKWHLVEEPAAFDYYEVLPGQGSYNEPQFNKKGEGNWPENIIQYKGHSSDVITDQSLNWLKSRKSNKPFYLSLHFKAPHASWVAAKRYEDYLENVEIPEPASMYYDGESGSAGSKGIDGNLKDVLGSSIGHRNKIRTLAQYLNLDIDENIPDPEYQHLAYQEFAKRYLRCVKGIDDNISRLLEYLDEEGLTENTVIFYSSDQGEIIGDHDYWDKRWMYEESIQMPLIIRYPGMIKPGTVSRALINNTDFAPTIIELAKGNVPNYMQGHSFKSILETGNEPDDWRKVTYYRYWMHMVHHGVPAHFGIRSKNYKLIFFYGRSYDPTKLNATAFPLIDTPVSWEFYDLEKDPHETDNRYDESMYYDIIKEMKLQLIKTRENLNETDIKYSHIKKVIEENWDIE